MTATAADRKWAYEFVGKWVSPFAEDAAKDQAVDELTSALLAHGAAERAQPMRTAPKDGTLFLCWAPEAHGLSAMYSLCAWHQDAGFCIDELRQPDRWWPLPAIRALASAATGSDVDRGQTFSAEVDKPVRDRGGT